MMMVITMIHEEFDNHSFLFDLSLGRNSYCPESNFWIVGNLKYGDVLVIQLGTRNMVEFLDLYGREHDADVLVPLLIYL